MAAGVLALAGPAPVAARDAPVLVEYLPVTAQSYRVLPETQAYALDDISRDPGVLNLRIGYATPEPVVRAGALSIELPGTDETLTIDDLVVENLDSGYALYSGDRLSETSNDPRGDGSGRDRGPYITAASSTAFSLWATASPRCTATTPRDFACLRKPCRTSSFRTPR